jgi:hypothetical protein
MIRKSMPSGHDAMGGNRFSLATNAKRCAETTLKQRHEIMIWFNLNRIMIEGRDV